MIVLAGRYNTQQSFLPIDSPVDRPVKANPAAPGISNPGGLAELSHPTARRPIPPAQDFKFPPASPAANGETVSSPLPGKSPVREALALPVPRFTRIISSSSQNGSNRSSGEFYSMSGNSTETLESEYTNYSSAGPRPKPTTRHTRGFSTVEPPGKFIKSQALLMGYAQISASFTVDGSLVNQSAFEEVKRKAVVGTQGSGGVSRNGDSGGHGKSRKSGGLWGALGLDSIEESISSLLSKNSLDGLRDMRGVSSSRSIPLLSTNQSLLFVDLRLAPGEEQSYMFTFTLPRGLPASHKGKAIKISYNLIIGTQRPSGPNEPQRVNRINIPFRVFSGVNGKPPTADVFVKTNTHTFQDKEKFLVMISWPPIRFFTTKRKYKKSGRLVHHIVRKTKASADHSGNPLQNSYHMWMKSWKAGPSVKKRCFPQTPNR